VKTTQVVAGILVDKNDQVLLSERVGDSPFAGMWEFPGGKIEDGESAAEALRRELMEELGVTVSNEAHFMDVDHRYDDRHVSIEFYLVPDWWGEPIGREGQSLCWVKTADLDPATLLPADAPVVDALKQLESDRNQQMLI
jgi:8-oxo-dGTP diphosphatase